MPQPASSEALGAAFADPVQAAQRVFRAVLSAMSEPGSVRTLAEPLSAPAWLSPASARLLLTLADYETPVWIAPDAGPEAGAYVRFHCGAPVVADPGAARFAVMDGAFASVPLGAFDAGEDRYPDRSATVIVQCCSLEGGDRIRLEGPGIETQRAVAPQGLHTAFWQEVAANHARHPLGIDLVLVAGDSLMALPRTTRATPIGDAEEAC